MNIQEATIAAMKINGTIKRASSPFRSRIKPTNQPECCILVAKGREPGPRWEPFADDLMADDWEVTTEEWT